MSLRALLSRFEDKPLKMTVLVIVAIVAARLAGEFGIGFAQGVIAGFADGI
ncbi:hypothetical protein [Caulobacter hibisci]|uniref:Uncharacterized protein n=1 Tax=Caulobacter hibisci TaxID=2035993 RepID=A0ABS0SZC0_9CAUL|nr:hypothetical protein [Caulobacter hibisci]MBI1684949.1 hypothetical protein [Caulobacter hibisci]